MDLEGRDIEVHEDDDIFRGPLSRVDREQDNIIRFYAEWCAEKRDDKWALEELADASMCGGTVDAMEFHESEDGSIKFSIPHIGSAIIFPKGQNIPRPLHA